MGNLATQTIIQNIQEIPLHELLKVHCNTDPKMYLLMETGILYRSVLLILTFMSVS